ncbi:four helix bundle protein [Desulfonatronum parangueonense]
MQTHKDLDLWKAAMVLVKQTYVATSCFPKEEIYGLTSQMRRAAVSIPSNIAEGAARQGNKEFCHYLYIALGSLAELETQLLLAQDLGYTKESTLLQHLESVRKMLLGMIRHLKKRDA